MWEQGSPGGGGLAIRYVVAVTSAPSGVFGIILPIESIVMNEWLRLLVASRLSPSGMSWIRERRLCAWPLALPCDEDSWMEESCALRRLDSSAARLRSSSAAFSAASLRCYW